MRARELEAIIIFGLGDCIPRGFMNIDLLAQCLEEKYGHLIVMTCCLEPPGMELSEAFAKCVRRGAGRIFVIPYVFELDEQQSWELALAVQEEARNLKNVEVIVGKPLGFDESFIHLAEKRIRESRELPDVRELALMKMEEHGDALWH